MGNKVKIILLKARANKYYNQFYNLKERYDCGNSLAEHINPDLAEIKSNFNKTIDELRAIDPSVSEFKL